MRYHKHLIAAGLCSLCVCGLAIADEHGSKSEASKRSQQQQEQGDRQSSNEANYRVSPSGWIRMAIDYDNDGRFDAIETIYTFDLEKARKSSRDRANRDAQESQDRQRSNGKEEFANAQQSSDDRQTSSDQRSSGKRSPGSRTGSRSQQETISGKILQLDSEQLSGMDEPCMIARIRTDNNWPAKAMLGPKSQLQKLQLAEGDEVTITGRKGRVNDKSMLLASTVKSDGKQVSVDMPSSRNAKRMRAELLSMRTTEFRNHDGKFVIAQVESQNGKTATVNLGAKSKVDQLKLSEGDELRMIVRPAKMNGQPGMVADQIRANGKLVEVSPPNRIAKRDRNRGDQSSTRDNRQASARSSDSQMSDSDSSSSKQAALGIAVGESDDGVVIVGVHPQSPAADTELQVGDAIVSINGDAVDSPQSLVDTISGMKPSEKIRLKVRRDGEEQTLQVKLTSRSELMSSLR